MNPPPKNPKRSTKSTRSRGMHAIHDRLEGGCNVGTRLGRWIGYLVILLGLLVLAYVVCLGSVKFAALVKPACTNRLAMMDRRIDA